ncbi:MAG TPA: DNA primase [Bacteroidetes bacterium]|nr:DNA primase [Bacteroidota bacterium]
MRIPPEKIEEIRSAIDIVDVISQHVRLKKRGKSFTGLCPFHQEKTPSFTVSSEKQVYHCFGCGRGGNVFTFVMEFEKISFTEAVRALAEKTGIVISFTESDQEHQSETESLYHACRFAGLTFHNNLTKTDEGRTALEYFHQRGFTDETIRTFGLGYSMNSWDGFVNRAKEEGLNREDLLKAGLLRSREDGTDYDYFRGRAMFPIFITTGRVVGFGARKLREDDPLGKYINSPETPIYNKSRILFGLFHSKDAVRSEDNALMVEGYADLISLYQAGIQNVVASSGTALTEEQVQLIARYTKKLTLVYDADSAGSNATLRGMDIALAQDLDISIVELPEGEDPDSFVLKSGGKEFRRLLGQSISFIDFKAKQFLRAGAFATPEGKAQAVRSIVQSIAKMRDELKRNFYIKEVAVKYDVYESILYRELERWTGAQPQRDRPLPGPATESSLRSSASPQIPVAPEKLKEGERVLLKALFENREDVARFVFANVEIDYLSTELAKKLFRIALEAFEDTGQIEVNRIVGETGSSELRDTLVDLVIERHELGQRMQKESEIVRADPMVIAKDAVKSLVIGLVKNARDQKRIELKRLPVGSPEALNIGSEIQDIVVRLSKLQDEHSGSGLERSQSADEQQ